jgi:hypothetical protein
MLVLAALVAGCLPVLAPHGEGRARIGFTAGATRPGASSAPRLTGDVDVVAIPTGLAGCDREFDLGLGARFHFVEPERPGLPPHRIGGLVSGTWLFFREPHARGELRLDLDVLALDDRPLAGATVSAGIEVIGFAEGTGVWGGWEGFFAGAWSGEAALRVEAAIGYHEDFGQVRYATFTAGLAVRWPAGAGVAVVNPIYLAIIAAEPSSPSGSSSAASSSTTTTSTTPSSSTSTAGVSSSTGSVRGCPEAAAPEGTPMGTGMVADPTPAAEPRYRCSTGDVVELVDADSYASALRACAVMLGPGCSCDVVPTLMTLDEE